MNATSLNEEDIIMGFARTFVIIRTAQGLGMFHAGEKYEIVNDIVLYYRPSVYQLHNSFKAPAVQGPINHPIDDDDKRGLEIIFHELTGLNSIWCNKYDLKKNESMREFLLLICLAFLLGFSRPPNGISVRVSNRSPNCCANKKSHQKHSTRNKFSIYK